MLDSSTMDTRDSNIMTSDCHCLGPENSRELGQTRQLGGTEVLLEDTDLIPSFMPFRNQEWQDSAQSRSSALHWVLPTAWAPDGDAADTAAADSAGDWTISTASVVQHSHYSAEHAALCMSDDAAAALDCSSDPLTCTAQLMLAASATPGVHCVRDSTALLNSGAVLLLGQGSTTMCGTNTAQGIGGAADGHGHFLNPEDTHSHVLSTPRHSVNDLQQQQLPMPAHQQQAAPTAAAGRAPPRRTRSRRRLGLLVDSELGLQQLVAPAAGHQHDSQDPDPHQHWSEGAQGGNANLHEQQQQQQCNMQCHTQHSSAGRTCESDHRVPSEHRGSNMQETLASRSSTSAAACTCAPASADFLVLGGSSAGMHDASAASAAPHAGSAHGPAGAAVAQQQRNSAQQGGVAAGAGTLEPQAAAILQLLSCSSLASNPPAGRSNSSLLHLSLSNCSVLRLGSFTLKDSSFSSSHDSSTVQSRAASFSGQHNTNGTAAAAAGIAAGAAVGWSVHSPVVGTVPLGPTSRPSPLPMVHESRSWGQNLDAADRIVDVQRRHSAHARPEASMQAAQQQQAHKQQAQLIYLLD